MPAGRGEWCVPEDRWAVFCLFGGPSLPLVCAVRPTGCLVPVTAKLSRQFYDRFGDEIANELVEWFNQVDATYRGDLRELNELNFARFDAKLEQRFAESDVKLERRFAQQDAKWEQRFAGLETRLLRWMFLFWATNLAALVGLARLKP